MCSITGVGERLHKVLGQIGLKLWFPGQQKALIDLKWGKRCLHLFSIVFILAGKDVGWLCWGLTSQSTIFQSCRDGAIASWVFNQYFLAGKEDMHKISNRFEFRPDLTTDYGVSCPWASKKFPIDLQWENAVSMLTHLFLIESSSKLLITKAGIKARTGLISGRIRLLTLKLLAIEWRKLYFELEYLWGQLANLDQILCVASLRVGKGCIMFWGRLDQNSHVHGNRIPHWLTIGKMMSSPFLGCFWPHPFYTCR